MIEAAAKRVSWSLLIPIRTDATAVVDLGQQGSAVQVVQLGAPCATIARSVTLTRVVAPPDSAILHQVRLRSSGAFEPG
jgi:hypothetical protein